VGSAEDRPMLAGDDTAGRIAALMKDRAPAYAQADITVDTTALGIDEAAERILALLKQFSAG
jgi:shikimate kinase